MCVYVCVRACVSCSIFVQWSQVRACVTKKYVLWGRRAHDLSCVRLGARNTPDAAATPPPPLRFHHPAWPARPPQPVWPARVRASVSVTGMGRVRCGAQGFPTRRVFHFCAAPEPSRGALPPVLTRAAAHARARRIGWPRARSSPPAPRGRPGESCPRALPPPSRKSPLRPP